VSIVAVTTRRASAATFIIGRSLPRFCQFFAGGKLLFPPFDDADSFRPRSRAGRIGRGRGPLVAGVASNAHGRTFYCNDRSKPSRNPRLDRSWWNGRPLPLHFNPTVLEWLSASVTYADTLAIQSGVPAIHRWSKSDFVRPRAKPNPTFWARLGPLLYSFTTRRHKARARCAAR
jgi:hypothetical protein